MGLFGKKEKTAGDWFDKGTELGTRKKYHKALECFDKVIELSKENDDLLTGSWILKGAAHFALKEYKEALKLFDKAMQLDPTYSVAVWKLKGYVYHYGIKDEKEAVKCFTKAKQIGEHFYDSTVDKGEYSVYEFKGVDIKVSDYRIRHAAIEELAIGRFQSLPRLVLHSGALHTLNL